MNPPSFHPLFYSLFAILIYLLSSRAAAQPPGYHTPDPLSVFARGDTPAFPTCVDHGSYPAGHSTGPVPRLVGWRTGEGAHGTAGGGFCSAQPPRLGEFRLSRSIAGGGRLDLYQEHVGESRVLWLYLWEPGKVGPEMDVTYVEPDGSLSPGTLSRYGDEGSGEPWRLLIGGLRERARERGWDPASIMVGSGHDYRASPVGLGSGRSGNGAVMSRSMSVRDMFSTDR